jgi:hypothetical protein
MGAGMLVIPYYLFSIGFLIFKIYVYMFSPVHNTGVLLYKAVH